MRYEQRKFGTKNTKVKTTDVSQKRERREEVRRRELDLEAKICKTRTPEHPPVYDFSLNSHVMATYLLHLMGDGKVAPCAPP